MIDKQVVQLILISLVGTGVSARGSLMWEETGVPGENLRLQAGNHNTLSHTTTAYHEVRTTIAIENETGHAA